MNRALLFAMAATLVGVAMFVRSRLPAVEEPRAKLLAAAEVTPVCPWRGPGSDLRVLFPPATNYVIETRALSSEI